MEGIPAADLAAWKKRQEEESGVKPQQNAPKRAKYANVPLTTSEVRAQLAAHKALMSGKPLPGAPSLPGGGYGVPPVGFGVPPPGFANMPPPPGFPAPPPGFVPPPNGMPFPPPPFPLPPGYVYRCRYLVLSR